MSMESEKKGFDNGYDEGYDAGYDKGRSDAWRRGYDEGYNECLINKREDWINYEVEILHRIKQVFCETDEDIEEFEKLWRNGAFHVPAPKRDEGPNVKIDPHLTNVLGNATMTYPWWKKIK